MVRVAQFLTHSVVQGRRNAGSYPSTQEGGIKGFIPTKIAKIGLNKVNSWCRI